MNLPPGPVSAENSDAVASRYHSQPVETLVIKRKPVLRMDYVDYVRPYAQGFESGPARGVYGPRHALPALAVMTYENNAKLAEGIKKTLRHYSDAMDKQIQEMQGVYSFEGGYLCAMHFRELRKLGFMTADDEKFARELILKLRKYQFAWKPNDGLWRGPQHRSQCQGVNHALAATLYPDEPGASNWMAYADAVWGDWWDYRDIGINDINYFFGCFQRVLCTAILLEREEVFTDKEVQKFIWERLLHETPPDGAVIPYGAHGGYNSLAGTKIFALEAAATYTRDGRYKWVAQRIMNFGQQRGFSNNHQHYQALSIEDIALASLICDDSIKPVQPEPDSKILMRKEVIRLIDQETKERFPDAGGVDCAMFMTQAVMPSKVVFRSGWEPGALYMLMESYVRHDPLNPTAIYALERYSSSFAEMAYEKFVSRENAVRIDDISGDASYLGHKDFQGEKALPTGYTGMNAKISEFSEHGVATYAMVNVTNYMGYEAEQNREILFVKNRFVLIRDETVFHDSFRAQVGPVWNTQNVDEIKDKNWLNTWFDAHYFQNARLYDNPPWDLLIYYAPRDDCTLLVPPAQEMTGGGGRVISTRYAWEGQVEPGMRLRFLQVLLPHAPMKDAAELAEGITVLRDEPSLAAVSIQQNSRTELVTLNAGSQNLELNLPGKAELSIGTDAKSIYVDIEGLNVKQVLVISGTYLKINGNVIFTQASPMDFERRF